MVCVSVCVYIYKLPFTQMVADVRNGIKIYNANSNFVLYLYEKLSLINNISLSHINNMHYAA